MPVVAGSESTIVRFGSFRLNLQSGELWNGPERTILPDQLLRILRTLVLRPGTLVTRDELRHELWANDTFVDFDHSLNAAIKRLREVLGDSATEPRFIETIPRRGYRLIAALENGVEPGGGFDGSHASASSRARVRWRVWVAGAVVAALLFGT